MGAKDGLSDNKILQILQKQIISVDLGQVAMKFEKYESLFRTVSNSFNFQGCFKGEKHFNILNYKLCFL